MTNWLIYPPFADPTQPYAALPYLKGSLRAAGLDATILDMNVEAAHLILGRAHSRACSERIAERFLLLDRRKQLNRLERMEYLMLADARAAALRLLSADVPPVKTFQDPARFYDFQCYRQARNLAEDALICTSAASFPYIFHFNQAAHAAVPWGTAMLESYYRDRRSPLDAFYRAQLFSGRIRRGDFVGINVTFISQLPEAFYLARMTREMLCATFIAMGGSCLQQILAQAGEQARRWIVTIADAACLYEGEQSLPMLIAEMKDHTGQEPSDRFERLGRIPNLLIREPGSGRPHATPLHRSDLKQLPAPDYSDLDLDRYLAPAKTLLFAPTRGCYWNRCAFCDYGLSRSECHGYREMEAGQAAGQLVALAQQYGVGNVYLSVDVMAPRFAVALAEALIARGAPVRWSADFRMEAYYSQERCRLLYRSGLRAVAFGVESGSDRMLQRMQKGLRTNLIRAIGARFHQAGIATAWMTFSGHPGEELQDALHTVGMIDQEQQTIDLFILGRFGVVRFSAIVISSVVATVISRHFIGDFPAFQVPVFSLQHTHELFFCALVGLLAAGIGCAFIWT
ncbi:MAG: hypothetical protein C4519_15940, partial [Desulfobacteraceae bacterium]